MKDASVTYFDKISDNSQHTMYQEIFIEQKLIISNIFQTLTSPHIRQEGWYKNCDAGSFNGISGLSFC